MALIIGDRPGPVYTCRGCGCTDRNACVDDKGQACSWVLLDIETPTGVCSSCAMRAKWDQRFLLMVWNLEAEDEAAA